MASTELEPITGVWGWSPQRSLAEPPIDPGRSPLVAEKRGQKYKDLNETI